MSRLLACISVVALLAVAGCAYAAEGTIISMPTAAPCPTPSPESWHYSVTPYMWLTSISGDVAARGREAHVDVGVGKIIEKLNWLTEFHAEARKNRFGFYVDPTYVKLSVGGSAQSNSASVGFREWLVDFAGTYRLFEAPVGDGGSQSVDFIAGGRFWSMKTDVTVQNVGSGSATKNWVDPIVGLRYTADLSRNWSVVAQGDIGGFGASSEFTWSAAPVFIYHLSANRALVFGYRALGVDHVTGSGTSLFKLDTTYHGPLLGYEFGF